MFGGKTVFPGLFLHAQFETGTVKKKIKKVLRKTHIEGRISLLIDEKIMKRFVENVIDLLDVGI